MPKAIVCTAVEPEIRDALVQRAKLAGHNLSDEIRIALARHITEIITDEDEEAA